MKLSLLFTLIDLLIKKGVINDQEAEDIRAELVKDFAGSPAGKLNLSTPLTEFKIAGDLRVRYEGRGGELPNGDDLKRDRFLLAVARCQRLADGRHEQPLGTER